MSSWKPVPANKRKASKKSAGAKETPASKEENFEEWRANKRRMENIAKHKIQKNGSNGRGGMAAKSTGWDFFSGIAESADFHIVIALLLCVDILMMAFDTVLSESKAFAELHGGLVANFDAVSW